MGWPRMNGIKTLNSVRPRAAARRRVMCVRGRRDWRAVACRPAMLVPSILMPSGFKQLSACLFHQPLTNTGK